MLRLVIEHSGTITGHSGRWSPTDANNKQVMLASLITDSWNQLLSWLKLVNTLREISGQTAICAQSPKNRLSVNSRSECT